MSPPPATFPLLLAAAGEHRGAGAADHTVAVFLLQILLLLLVGRLLGEGMQRVKQPAVMGQLLAGILLGPSILGALAPGWQHALFPADPVQKKMLDAVSQLGVLMLLLLTGMETDLALVKRVRRTAAIVSAFGVFVPFACGYALGELLPASMLPDPGRRLLTSLFLATALSISSVKIVAAVLREVNFLRRNLGQIILASAILDDTIGWVIIALIGGIAAHGRVDVGPLALSVGGTAAFLVVSFTVGRRVVARLIRWVNDRFTIETPVITAILVLMLAMALLTDLIGVHTVLGAFVAGILIGQSPILTKHIEEQLRGLIVALFMPVFFGVAGLSIDLTILKDPRLLGLAMGFIAIASFGKLAGCYVGGRLGRLGSRESTALAIGMNARGSTEVIVASIGLAMGVLNRELFTLIVLMAVATTLVTPPLLRWALARVPISDDERAREEKERAQEGDFVPGLERLLIAVDNSADGKLAARLAGLFAGARQLTATVLDLAAVPAGDGKNGAGTAPGTNRLPNPASPATAPAGAVVAAAERAGRTAQELEATVKGNTAAPGDPTVANIVEKPLPAQELITVSSPPVVAADPAHTRDERPAALTLEEHAPGAVLAEAAKGYGLIFLGLERALEAGAPGEAAAGGAFRPAVEKIIREFAGPSAVAIARGPAGENGDGGGLNILVPTTGADYSRRGAEVAIAIAKGCGGRVTALHVSRPPLESDLMRRPEALLQAGRALVEDVAALGRREGVRVDTRVLVRPAQEASILRQIERGRHDLVVLGTKARPGERLFFGHSVTVLLERIPCSLVVVNS